MKSTIDFMKQFLVFVALARGAPAKAQLHLISAEVKFAVYGKKMIDFDVVREIAVALPDVKESTIHGAPSLKVRGRLLTCPALHSSAEPNSLMVRIDFDRRAELMKAEPDVYYLTNHYVNHPSVLVRLSRIDRTALKDLLDYAWRFVSSGTKASKLLG